MRKQSSLRVVSLHFHPSQVLARPVELLLPVLLASPLHRSPSLLKRIFKSSCWFVVIFSPVCCNRFVKSYISKCSQFCLEYDKK